MTACAPNTYHRPHRARTCESASSSSTAAGVTGITKESGQAHVRGEVVAPVVRVRPCAMLHERLSPQLVGDAEPLKGPEATDALGPVGILGFAHGAPVA